MLAALREKLYISPAQRIILALIVYPATFLQIERSQN